MGEYSRIVQSFDEVDRVWEYNARGTKEVVRFCHAHGARLVYAGSSSKFGNDGQAKITMLGQTLQGTYKINGGDELEWTVNGTTTKYKTKVSATELELTSEGKTVIYKKV